MPASAFMSPSCLAGTNQTSSVRVGYTSLKRQLVWILVLFSSCLVSAYISIVVPFSFFFAFMLYFNIDFAVSNMMSPERQHILSLGYSLQNEVHAMKIFYLLT